ncbi:MAG: hypothetical protein GPJ51_11795 [Candidatus Heimdallarchaeota archaeon]|nr:hypothetical protein [Candidatus Heimdallarchaeota archaeon]
MIRSSVIIFTIAGIVGITLAALGYQFFISFFSGMSVMIIGILIESIIITIKRKKRMKKRGKLQNSNVSA